jgi:hypothetical protein
MRGCPDGAAQGTGIGNHRLQGIMHLGNAIAAHEDWKTTFRNAIEHRTAIDAATVSVDNCCALGLWLYGEGNTLFGSLASHTHCVATHRIFHREAGKIAAAINAANFAEAERMLAAQEPFSAASNALAAAILRLKKDAAVSGNFISLLAKLSQ